MLPLPRGRGGGGSQGQRTTHFHRRAKWALHTLKKRGTILDL